MHPPPCFQFLLSASLPVLSRRNRCWWVWWLKWPFSSTASWESSGLWRSLYVYLHTIRAVRGIDWQVVPEASKKSCSFFKMLLIVLISRIGCNGHLQSMLRPPAVIYVQYILRPHQINFGFLDRKKAEIGSVGRQKKKKRWISLKVYEYPLKFSVPI